MIIIGPGQYHYHSFMIIAQLFLKGVTKVVSVWTSDVVGVAFKYVYRYCLFYYVKHWMTSSKKCVHFRMIHTNIQSNLCIVHSN